MFSIDELMYINDGIDPYKQYGYWDIFLRENQQYNKGGIIVKPKRQNAIVGGAIQDGKYIGYDKSVLDEMDENELRKKIGRAHV